GQPASRTPRQRAAPGPLSPVELGRDAPATTVAVRWASPSVPRLPRQGDGGAQMRALFPGGERGGTSTSKARQRCGLKRPLTLPVGPAGRCRTARLAARIASLRHRPRAGQGRARLSVRPWHYNYGGSMPATRRLPPAARDTRTRPAPERL